MGGGRDRAYGCTYLALLNVGGITVFKRACYTHPHQREGGAEVVVVVFVAVVVIIDVVIGVVVIVVVGGGGSCVVVSGSDRARRVGWGAICTCAFIHWIIKVVKVIRIISVVRGRSRVGRGSRKGAAVVVVVVVV